MKRTKKATIYQAASHPRFRNLAAGRAGLAGAGTLVPPSACPGHVQLLSLGHPKLLLQLHQHLSEIIKSPYSCHRLPRPEQAVFLLSCQGCSSTALGSPCWTRHLRTWGEFGRTVWKEWLNEKYMCLPAPWEVMNPGSWGLWKPLIFGKTLPRQRIYFWPNARQGMERSESRDPGNESSSPVSCSSWCFRRIF